MRIDLHEVHRAATVTELEADGDLFEMVGPLRDLLAEIAAGEPGVWRHRAACKGTAVSKFFPAQGEHLDDVRAICETCPVRLECAEHALGATGLSGIWGGMSERQRNAIRRTRRTSSDQLLP